MTVPTLPMEKVLDRIRGKIENYPKGSLSKREIVCTVPIENDPEVTFAAVDKQVTKAVYKTAQDSAKRFSGKPHRSVPPEELAAATDAVRSAVSGTFSGVTGET